MTRLEAFVISWEGMGNAARRIAENLSGQVDRLVVIYSNANGTIEEGPGEWIMVPDDYFYGKKFKESLDLFTGDVMLQIQADAKCIEWDALVARCRACFHDRNGVAVWAPDVDFTPWPLNRTKVMDVTTDLHRVALVDGIVWALSATVCTRLQSFDYRYNNLGWGMDWAATCFAHSTGMDVLVDDSVHVNHPSSRGYSPDSAEARMERFLEQMNEREKVYHQILRGYLEPKMSERPVRDGIARLVRKKRTKVGNWVRRHNDQLERTTRAVPEVDHMGPD